MKNKILFLIFGSLILLLSAFQNGYPLVYPDTGTYIYSGFSRTVPVDRPALYGFFARHVSLAVSPWLIIFAQGFILSWLIWNTIQLFKVRNHEGTFIVSVVLLSLFTAISPTVSILIPDIFTAIALLALFNLLLNKKLSSTERILTGITLSFAIGTHLSNFAIVSGTLGIFLIYNLTGKRRVTFDFSIRRVALVAGFVFFPLLFVPTFHYLLDRKFVLTEGSHVFMVNHLNEIGILQPYLEESCETKDYKICAYKDQLKVDLMWDESGPLYKTGGWVANKEEYNSIIKDVLTTPQYLMHYIASGVEYSFRQFFYFDIHPATPWQGGSAPYYVIHQYFPVNSANYDGSLQNKGEMDFSFQNHTQRIWVIGGLALLFLVMMTSLRNTISPELRMMIFFVITALVVNAAVCGVLSTVNLRFQSRIVWFIPFLTIFIVPGMIQRWLLAFKRKDEGIDSKKGNHHSLQSTFEHTGMND